jgi:predicted lipoprotein with Yx(FWY)xxD motif
MKTFATLTLAVGMAAAFTGASFAQSSMSSMTSSEKTTLTKCQGMSPSSMQQDSQCSALMKKYPGAFNGTTGSGSSGMNGSSTTSPSSSSGGMSPSSPSR